jgi:hypothetical protein
VVEILEHHEVAEIQPSAIDTELGVRPEGTAPAPPREEQMP